MGHKCTGRISLITVWPHTYSVQNNGGTIENLEKNAQILIADHVRRDAPPGSYSWQLIEKAVTAGSLPEDIEDYRIKPKGTVRAVGASAPGKSTRTPFTKADDDILIKWVLKAERRGVSAKGNEMYKSLEETVSFTLCVCHSKKLYDEADSSLEQKTYMAILA